MKVVVFGDVHGNARALRAALAQAATQPFDELVFIGDLLTYGHDIDEVLDLVADEQARRHARVLLGNHDQMYIDLARGERAYFDSLPPWIRASVEHTLERLGDTSLAARVELSEEHVLAGVLFAHANPFGSKDWTYLNRAQDVARAREALATRGFRAGVFGHTHRPARWDGEPRVFNVGSVGQPRDSQRSAVIARLDLDLLEMAIEPIDYDVHGHVAALRRSGLDAEVIAKLVNFF